MFLSKLSTLQESLWISYPSLSISARKVVFPQDEREAPG
jgi:hypothetical protein